MSVKTAFKTQFRKLLADTVTPVSLYLKLRDHFANPMLLESSDYHGDDNTLSVIGLEPFASFEVRGGKEIRTYPDGTRIENELPVAGKIKMASSELRRIPESLQRFLSEFPLDHSELPFAPFGAFGYQAYDMVRYYEKVGIQEDPSARHHIPEMQYFLYRYLLVINHFHNELYLIEYQVDDNSKLKKIETLINSQALPVYEFETRGEEGANMKDEEFLDMVAKGKYHCQRGDVFQIVLSRQYTRSFQGDEFNVYRALRSINPSPYLFFCDFGNFKLFGSSPEAQLIIEDGKATIHPIAGTYKRTGNDEEDLAEAKKLFDDPKENSEHVMLVDLARNDLSRHGNQVEVDTYKEIQYYSHVIHLVSKVVADIDPGTNHLQLMADTFPAGTLSGAPKVRAMQLIDEYEPQSRGFYGGCIGWLNGEGRFNHAIMIRSFLARGNTLFYQAGAGIVSRSVPENELQEVHNKLGALRKAIDMAAGKTSTPSSQG